MKRKVLKRWSILLVLLLMTVWMSGCSESMDTAETEEKLYGNLQGNILNGGNLVEEDGIIYYAPTNDPSVSGNTSCVYKIENSTSSSQGYQKTKLVELPSDYPVINPCLCLWGDDLYVLQKKTTNVFTKDGVIRKVSLESGETEDIVTGKAIIQMQIRDGKLYYLEAKDNAQYTASDIYLIRSNLDGSEAEELMCHMSLAAEGDFFFTENEEDPSTDSAVFIAPHNFQLSADYFVVTNLETGDSGLIEPESWREEIASYGGLGGIWPEGDTVYCSAAPSHYDATPSEDYCIYRVNETEKEIETVLSGGGSGNLCLFNDELYMLKQTYSDGTWTRVIERTNLETMETETYPADAYEAYLEELSTNSQEFTLRLQASSMGVFLVISPYSGSNYEKSYHYQWDTSSLYYLNPSDLIITEIS